MRIHIIILSVLAPLAALAQNLTLEECIGKAQANYPAVRQYGLIERSKDYNLSNASKAWLPQIGVSAGALAFTDILDGDFLGNMGVEMDNYLLNASVSVNQSIYDGGQTAAGKRVLRAQSEVERIQTDVTMYDISERIQQIYFGILLIDEQTAQNSLLQEDLAICLKSVVSLAEGGLANQSDIEAVKVEQLNACQQEAALRSCRKAYIRMLGVMMGENLPEDVVLSLPQTLEEIGESDGFVLRPELTLFSAQENLLDEQRKQINTRLRPTLGAFLTATAHNKVTDLVNTGMFAGGLSLSWNIGALYTRKNDIRKLEVQRLLVDTDRDIFLINNKLSNEEAKGSIEALKEQIGMDDEIVSLRQSIRSKSEKKVMAGTESVNEMLRDINAVSQARNQKAIHEIQLVKEQYNLRHIVGEQR